MRRPNLSLIVSILIALITVGLAATSARSADSWFWWRKSDKSASNESRRVTTGSKTSSTVDEPASQQYATTPTLENRKLIAPTNTVAIKKPAQEHWWDRFRIHAKKTENSEVARQSSPVKDQVPVVVKKSKPPSLENIATDQAFTKNSSASAKLRNDAVDEPTASDVDEPVRVITSPIAAKQVKSFTATSTPRLQTSRASSSNQIDAGSVKRVAYDVDGERQSGTPTPDLRTNPTNENGVLPFDEKPRSPKIQIRQSEISDEMISLTVREAPLSMVLSLIAEQHGLNLIAGSEIDGRVTVTLNDVPLDEALNALLSVNGYSWHRNQNILVISKLVQESRSSPILRGIVLRVFRLNYISAIDVEKVVMTLLSPAGRAVTTVVDLKNTRRTREEIVVEDLPEYTDRIAAYIAEVDRPPRQVLIEAHVLQVNLKDDCLHGVNLQKLINVGNTQISLQTTGFANPNASPAFFFGVDNNEFHMLVQALSTLTDSKTLADTRVLCLNGQHAKIHVGEQLGFLVTTTTQTSTLQNVNFLNVGVILDVTPVITDEGLVMLSVKPSVSGGQISQNGLPSANTTEVESTVMLADGHGMVIGGLIKEEDTEVQTKIPYLGDLWVVGRLFQQRTVLRQRNEIIIALIPYILPHPDDKLAGMDDDLERVRTRLLSPPLERVDRRQWEPDPPDAILNPKHLFSGEILRRLDDPYGNGQPPICEVDE